MTAQRSVEALRQTILDNKIDVVMIDPFVASHRVTESDNNAIELVAKQWTRLADETNCAVDLAHHVRKTGGAEITSEDALGASALLNAVRASRVLNTMSKEEAKSAGIDAPRTYFKIGDGKMNLAPPAEYAKWHHLESVDLGNAPVNDPFDTEGDNVGVVTQWEWPDPLDGYSERDLEKIFAAVRNGEWRADPQANDWVGKAVGKAVGWQAGRQRERQAADQGADQSVAGERSAGEGKAAGQAARREGLH